MLGDFLLGKLFLLSHKLRHHCIPTPWLFLPYNIKLFIYNVIFPGTVKVT